MLFSIAVWNNENCWKWEGEGEAIADGVYKARFFCRAFPSTRGHRLRRAGFMNLRAPRSAKLGPTMCACAHARCHHSPRERCLCRLCQDVMDGLIWIFALFKRSKTNRQVKKKGDFIPQTKKHSVLPIVFISVHSFAKTETWFNTTVMFCVFRHRFSNCKCSFMFIFGHSDKIAWVSTFFYLIWAIDKPIFTRAKCRTFFDRLLRSAV